ncbi:MAG: OmpA family protein [Spirochaetales bacterium]|nr:OmpA family protein [Spirochaetales bacterium]
MKGTIQLEIEHVKYKDFVDFDNLKDKRMVLAPIKEDQDKAILRFFYERESFRKLVHEETITLVPFKKNTEILLKGTPKNPRRVDCSVQVDNGQVQYFTLNRPINIAALVLALVGAAALALIAIFVVPAIIRAISAAAQERAAKAKTEAVSTAAGSGNQGTTTSAAGPTESAGTTTSVVSEKKRENVVVYFLEESAVLRPAEKKKLDALVKKLKDRKIESCIIEGHTADYHSRESQLEVSENRVISVQQYLKSALGSAMPAAEKDYFGSTQKVSTGKADENLDRRAEIIIEYYE